MPLRQGTPVKWGPLTVGTVQAASIGSIGGFDSGGQQASVSLKMNLAGYVQPVNPKDPASKNECYVVADLAGSVVSPGDLSGNDDENRGFYIHAIDVHMSFDDVYAVETEAPPPSAATGSGSVSSGSSASVGFFGSQLTATDSWSTSQGGGRSYQDYENESHTTHKTNLGGSEVMKQHIALRLCDIGPYVTPFSLVTSDHYLAGLPARAIGNLPLMSAASFMVEAPVKTYPSKATLRVSIKPWLAKVTWLNPYNPVHWFDHQDLSGLQAQEVGEGALMETVAEYDMTRGPGVYEMMKGGILTGFYVALPWSNEYAWSFVVDFENGQVQPS